MRTYLTLFLFGSIMLTGCADDLVGPTMDATGIDAPVAMRDVAPPTIFKTWQASEIPSDYRMTFRNTERANQPSNVDDFRLAMSGYGAYNPQHSATTPEAPADRVSFSIEGNVAADRKVSLTFMGADGEVMAEGKGQADALFTRLDMNITFADGSTQSVTLAPAEPIAPTEEQTAMP